MNWCVWITGLPGSGKTTITKKLLEKLEASGIGAKHLRMDEVRKMLTPKLEYTKEERDLAYKKLVSVAKDLVKNGTNTIIDATGHRKKWRDSARSQIKNFIEVFVDCPLEVCIERETKRKDNLVIQKMYEKAKERVRGKEAKGLGEVVGIDVPYERPDRPEVVVESDKISEEESAEKIFEKINEIFYDESLK